MQLNRRYSRGFQFAIAYTFAKALGVADDDEQQVSAVRPLKEWHYAPLAGTQTHNLVINYTWDLPKASKLARPRGRAVPASTTGSSPAKTRSPAATGRRCS